MSDGKKTMVVLDFGAKLVVDMIGWVETDRTDWLKCGGERKGEVEYVRY